MGKDFGGGARAATLAFLLLGAAGLARADVGIQATFLANYFGHTNYEAIPHSFDGLDFVFAQDKKEVRGHKVLTKAIAFRISGREIEPLLYVNNETCSNSTGELFTARVIGNTFAGWEFILLRNSIAAIFYSIYHSNGVEKLSITDGDPTFEWNRREEKFQIRPVDTSQW